MPVRKAGFVSGGDDFQARAACREVGSAPFFSPEGERGRDKASREAAAKKVCFRCPVLQMCAELSLARREPYGTWGGMTEDERHDILQRRAQAALEVAA
ncbi:WhiB family transcriptional regulator [Kitasatospora sp. CMC57]|uniref:WhiB family transcriptional regulator n=1 Tax=Kitasatospora sp. CMC57 TaxID=3231513 RepID=UPI0038B62A68